MRRRVLVTGATGFVGKAVVERLATAGFTVRAAVRSPSLVPHAKEHIVADVSDVKSLRTAVSDCDSIIHLVAIIKEIGKDTFQKVIAQGTRNLLEAATGIERFVYVSALGAEPEAPGDYYRAKWQAEEAIRDTRLPHTILRPSIIHGRGDAFISQFAGKPAPLPADGQTKFQPVHVTDVAEILSRAALQDADGVFELGGPDVLTLRQMIDIVEEKRGKKAWHPAVPLGLAKVVAKLVFDPLLKLGANMPASSAAMEMLERDNICAPGQLDRTISTFGTSLKPFAESV